MYHNPSGVTNVTIYNEPCSSYRSRLVFIGAGLSERAQVWRKSWGAPCANYSKRHYARTDSEIVKGARLKKSLGGGGGSRTHDAADMSRVL